MIAGICTTLYLAKQNKENIFVEKEVIKNNMEDIKIRGDKSKGEYSRETPNNEQNDNMESSEKRDEAVTDNDKLLEERNNTEKTFDKEDLKNQDTNTKISFDDFFKDEKLEIPNDNISISTLIYFYIALGIESLIFSLSSIYLAISKFNNFSFKEIRKNNDKMVNYFLGVILITIILTTVLSCIL